jgi:hypothetical protein
MGEKQGGTSPLVPGRECGGCIVCCVAPKINLPELKKHAGEMCRHCTGTGCAIYDARPNLCRDWYCGWRRLRELDESWRPDRSGVLINVVADGIPPAYAQVGLKFDIVGPPSVLTWVPLIKLIAAKIAKRVPVFLGVPAPVGFERRKVFLNDRMAEAVAAHDRIRMRDGLKRAFDIGLSEATKERSTFD